MYPRIFFLLATVIVLVTVACSAPSTTTTSMVENTALATPMASATVVSPETASSTLQLQQRPADSGNADVLFVRAEKEIDGLWTFTVTVQHPDTGWEDYADGWDIVTPDGKVLKPDSDSQFTRTLLHPHENEQPFTRSQSGIEIPDGVEQVTVRAHDLVDGYGGQQVVVDLSQTAGQNFEVIP